LAQKYALPFFFDGKKETKRTPALFSTKYTFYFNMYEKKSGSFHGKCWIYHLCLLTGRTAWLPKIYAFA